MNAFEYANPTTVDDAIGLLSDSWGETEILAGGTDLLSVMKNDLSQPGRVVSLSGIKELRGVSSSGGAVQVGATTTLKEFIADGEVRKNFPGLVTAVKNIASAQMINMGTVGGDLLQRPRCWYYRNGFGLLGTQDGKALVPDGDNRYHAIFGGGPAYFVNPSSLAPMLIALGATASIQGPGGKRDIAVADLFSAPKSEGEREFTIKSNEILTGISIPVSGMKNGIYEIRQRRGLDWPMVAAAVAIGGSGSRVVLGHVAPVPWVSDGASKALGGGTSDSAVQSAADEAVSGAKPLSRNGYKVHQVKVAVKRAVAAALA